MKRCTSVEKIGFTESETWLTYLLEQQGIAEVPTIVQQFRDYVGSEEFGHKERTTSEDIQLGNQVINYVLQHF